MSRVVEFPKIPSADRETVERMARLILDSESMVFVAKEAGSEALVFGYRKRGEGNLELLGMLSAASWRLAEDLVNVEGV